MALLFFFFKHTLEETEIRDINLSVRPGGQVQSLHSQPSTVRSVYHEEPSLVLGKGHWGDTPQHC